MKSNYWMWGNWIFSLFTVASVPESRHVYSRHRGSTLRPSSLQPLRETPAKGAHWYFPTCGVHDCANTLVFVFQKHYGNIFVIRNADILNVTKFCFDFVLFFFHHNFLFCRGSSGWCGVTVWCRWSWLNWERSWTWMSSADWGILARPSATVPHRTPSLEPCRCSHSSVCVRSSKDFSQRGY